MPPAGPAAGPPPVKAHRMPRKPAASIRDRVKEFRRIPAADLQDNAGNFRLHPQAQQDALAGVLKEVGIAGALLAYYSEREGGALTLVDGKMRRQKGGVWPVLILDVDDAEADLLLATHDQLTAMADKDREPLRALLERVQSGEAAVQAMLSALAEDTGVMPRDTAPLAASLQPARTHPADDVEDDPGAEAREPAPPRLVTCPACGEQFPPYPAHIEGA